MRVALTSIITEKLDSISSDIKTHVNFGAYIAESSPESLPELTKDEIFELMEIRGKIKLLARTLKDRLGK